MNKNVLKKQISKTKTNLFSFLSKDFVAYHILNIVRRWIRGCGVNCLLTDKNILTYSQIAFLLCQLKLKLIECIDSTKNNDGKHDRLM